MASLLSCRLISDVKCYFILPQCLCSCNQSISCLSWCQTIIKANILHSNQQIYRRWLRIHNDFCCIWTFTSQSVFINLIFCPAISIWLDTFFMVYGIERAPPPLPVVVWSSWLGLWTLNPAARVRIPVRPFPV